mmetsp:Transcript_33426/g.92359  ORF Transcript_33426/g.92359 Transcript_33426/m.92359 type:complete len:328 (+) Transcript_33426:446-1429(+)
MAEPEVYTPLSRDTELPCVDVVHIHVDIAGAIVINNNLRHINIDAGFIRNLDELPLQRPATKLFHEDLLRHVFGHFASNLGDSRPEDAPKLVLPLLVDCLLQRSSTAQELVLETDFLRLHVVEEKLRLLARLLAHQEDLEAGFLPHLCWQRLLQLLLELRLEFFPHDVWQASILPRDLPERLDPVCDAGLVHLITAEQLIDVDILHLRTQHNPLDAREDLAQLHVDTHLRKDLWQLPTYRARDLVREAMRRLGPRCQQGAHLTGHGLHGLALPALFQLGLHESREGLLEVEDLEIQVKTRLRLGGWLPIRACVSKGVPHEDSSFAPS